MQLKDIARQLEYLLKQIEMELGPDNTTTDTIDQSDPEFLPPLQSELELIKRNAGVDSVYDDQINNTTTY